MKQNRRRIFQILAAVVMVLAFIAAFLLYTRWSEKHIREQNVEQAKDNTLLTAATISENALSSCEEINVIAGLYSAGADSEESAGKLFRAVVDSGIFDEFEAGNLKGEAFGYAGRFAQLSGRDYYKNGLAGEKGITVVFGSFSGKTVTLAYAPAVYDGEIRGVLFGMHEAQKLFERVFTMTELNSKADTYLCTAEGYIFASSRDVVSGASVLYVEELNDAARSAISRCASTKQAVSVEMTDGISCCVVTPVEGTDWTLLQVFPDRCFTGRYRSATNGIVQLAFFLIVVFMMFLLFWMMMGRFETAQLKAEVADVDSYRKAVQADAVILLSVNLNKNELIDGEWVDSHRRKMSLYQLLGLRLPCSYDSYIARWKDNFVREESKALFAENTSRAFLMKSFADGKSEVSFDYAARDVEGKDVYLRRTISMIRLEKTGEIMAYTSVKDITAEAAESNRRREELTEALSRAEELGGKTEQFIEDIRRDVRIPADAALSYASSTYAAADRPDAVKHYLEWIAVAGQHLLSVTGGESGELSESKNVTELFRLIKELGALLTPKLTEKNLSFAGDLGNAYERVVYTNKLALSRVLLNLLRNMIERSCSSGSLVCSIRQTPVGDKVRTRFILRACAELAPADEDLMRSVCDCDSSPVGVAGDLLRSMGGKLTLSPDGGFAAELILEPATGLGEPLDERLRAIEASNLNGGRVLILSGSREREILDRSLSQIGFVTEYAEDGDDCMERLSAADCGTYRAVILSMDPGNGNMFDLTTRIRGGANGRVPVIGVTATPNEDERAGAYTCGMNAYLPLEIDKRVILTLLGTVL